MSQPQYLGEFEQVVLWAILRLGDEAYGALVIDELAGRIGRNVSSGALYATLDRLEAKKVIESRLAGADPRRGGRRRRYLSVTDAGRAALSRTRAVWTQLWDGLEPEGGSP